MPTVTGRIHVVQEGRFKLLTEDGRGLLFVLHRSAPIEAQDLPALKDRRIRVRYEETPKLIAGVARDLIVLDVPSGRPQA